MWSRYVLKRRAERYREQSLLQSHRQSLAYGEIEKVKVDCSFLPDSSWGVISLDPASPASPAWLLYLDFRVNQPRNCSLSNANIEVTIHQPRKKHEGKDKTALPRVGPIITEYFGPQFIDRQTIAQYARTIKRSQAQGASTDGHIITLPNELDLFSSPEAAWSLRGGLWPAREDTSGLPRRVEWSMENVVSQGKFRLGLIIQHEMEPFSLKVKIDGELEGEGYKKYRFACPAESRRSNLKTFTVKPTIASDQRLDEIASQLDKTMTKLNIENYSTSNTVDQGVSLWSEISRLCLEPQVMPNIPDHVEPQVAQVPQYTHDDYTIAWICALPLEMAAAEAMLEGFHPQLPLQPGDTNHYTLGHIGPHNIVIACLPQYGTTPAAVLATHLLYTFRKIRIRLMVGIGGGAPTEQDIRLGDVVVSRPTRQFGGVIQYDMGKNTGGRIQQTGMLNKPPPALLGAIAGLQSKHLRLRSSIPAYVEEMLQKHPAMRESFTQPGPENDQLFLPDYAHVDEASTCETCDMSKQVKRSARVPNNPKIHYGLIASANQVMRDAPTRDRIAKELGVLCFEMEAAGLMDNFTCLVVRGICDYADSHKNKMWQGYAAAVAAAYAKELLSMVSVVHVRSAPTALPEFMAGSPNP